MKRAILIVIIFLPLVLAAQENSPSPIKPQTQASNSLQAAASSIGSYAFSTDAASATETGFGAETDSQKQPSAAPPQATKPSSESKTTIPGTMVAYVDSAIIGSQVRIRFDDAFHDSAPDRAEFFYPQCSCTNVNGAPGPNFPGASGNINFQQIYLEAEYAPVSRFSIFTEVPFRWIEPQPGSFLTGSYDPNATPPEVPSTQTNSGISDVRAGFKLALAASSNHSLTAQLKAYFPSGDGSLGLGTDHYSIEPSLLYYQRLSQRWVIESQIGDSHPIGGSLGETVGTTTLTNFAGDVFFYGIGPSYLLINGEHFKLAPVVEMFGWHVLSGLGTLPGSFTQPGSNNPLPSNYICSIDNTGTTGLGCSNSAGGTNIVNLKVGLRTSFGNRNSVYVGFGQAVTHAVWYEHIIRIEYRYSF
jgi:hypothetical protein